PKPGSDKSPFSCATTAFALGSSASLGSSSSLRGGSNPTGLGTGSICAGSPPSTTAADMATSVAASSCWNTQPSSSELDYLRAFAACQPDTHIGSQFPRSSQSSLSSWPGGLNGERQPPTN